MEDTKRGIYDSLQVDKSKHGFIMVNRKRYPILKAIGVSCGYASLGFQILLLNKKESKEATYKSLALIVGLSIGLGVLDFYLTKSEMDFVDGLDE
jgi:hypothetical protein